MSWKPEVDEIMQRRAWAERLGGPEAVAKHHARGRRTIRERIAMLTDAGSFQEIGQLAGKGEYRDGRVVNVTPQPFVMGLAKIDGRPVALGGEDFTGDGTLFMLRVRGDSMIEAGIFDGDFVVVRQQPTADNGDTVVAGIPGDEATVKTFLKKGNKITLRPANASLTDMV